MKKYFNTLEECRVEIDSRIGLLPDVRPKSIPSELRELIQWLCWRYDPTRNKNGMWRISKTPYQALTPKSQGEYNVKAKTNDPCTWCGFDKAYEIMMEFDFYHGIGLVFSPDDVYTGFDFDNCRNPETGKIHPIVTEWLQRLHGYSEISVSGTGEHQIVRGKLPNTFNTGVKLTKYPEENMDIEVYDKRRYFIFTGIATNGVTEIPEAQPVLDEFIDFYHSTRKERKHSIHKEHSPTISESKRDNDVIEILQNGKESDKFKALWHGNWQAYNYTSQSEADLALCCFIAWYANDKHQVDSIFRQSKLYRDKWERPDYRNKTIDKAIASVAEAKQQSKQSKLESNVEPEPPTYTSDGRRVICLNFKSGATKQENSLRNEVFEILSEINQKTPTLFYNDGWRHIPPNSDCIEIISPKEFRAKLAEKFNWVRYKNGKVQPVMPVPAYIAESVAFHQDRFLKIPKLERVLNSPVITESGEFITQRGYVPALKAYLINDFNIQLMPPDQAREVILELIKDFPFKSESGEDKAIAIAYPLTILLRHLLGDHVPMFHFSGAKQGTGKTLLAETLYRIVAGDIELTPYPANEEALQRSLNSKLLSGQAGVIFDNVRDGYSVNSPYLAAIATARKVSIKILYHTKEIVVPVHAVIAFTGNNLSFDGDLRRRTQTCRLEIDMARPELRENLPNINTLIHKNRVLYLSAFLSMVKAWHDKGRPEQTIAYGSFERWAGVIASILEVVGIEGFDPIHQKPTDIELANRGLIAAIWKDYGTQKWGVNDVLKLTGPESDQYDILTPLLIGHYKNINVKMGHVLKTFVDQVFDLDGDVSVKVQQIPNTSPICYQLIRLIS